MIVSSDGFILKEAGSINEKALHTIVCKWIRQHYPSCDKPQEIELTIKDFHTDDIRGLCDEYETHRHINLNARFIDSPIFPAIVVHEVGHYIDSCRSKRRILRLIRFLRNKRSGDGFDEIDFWLYFVSGAYVLGELCADGYAITIMEQEKLNKHLLLEEMKLPLPRSKKIRYCVANAIVKVARITHYHLRTLM